MLKYVSGDILLSSAEAIAHGIAPNDDFKQGLALSLRERWPSLYKDFRHFCQTKAPKEGSLWAWKGAGGPVIFNLLTQEAPKTKNDHPGKANSPNINHSLKALKIEVANNDYKSLAITKVATGVGGMPWKEVKPLLEKHLGDLDIPVYIYEEYKKDVAAAEG